MLTEFAGGQQGAAGGERGRRGCAGPALRVSPWMAACDGVPLMHGSIIVGVAHAGCGQLREDRVDGRARFGGQIAADRAHAVDVLVADAEAAAAGAVDVGEVAVGVEAVGELVGQLGQLIGAVLAGQAGQLRFGFVPGLDVDEVGQPVPEAADHRDMAGAEVAVALCFGGRGQHRRQRFAVQSPAARPSRRLRGCAVMPRRG